MLNFRLLLKGTQRQALLKRLKRARQIGDLWLSNRILSILNFVDGWSVKDIASMLKVCVDSVRQWIGQFLCSGVAGLKRGKSHGRPPKLTKSERRELAKLIDQGPAKAGFCGNCWRSPMIQQLILDKFGVLFRSLHQPTAQGDGLLLSKGSICFRPSSGKRKGYKVFGLIDYFTGKFFYKCQQQRLNSETYTAFLKQLLSQTRKPIVLVQDGAPYHISAAMKAFFEKHKDRLSVHRLPSYSPDFNLIEKLWKKVKEKGTHLHYFPTFEALMHKVHESLMQFKCAPKEVLALFGMYYSIDHAS